MSRIFRPSRLIVFCALLFCCTSPSDDHNTQRVQVLTVIDGDTIELTDGRVVRYMCIDTPERGKPFYEEATQLNHDLVYGQTITLRFGRRKLDRYGRTLARVFVENISIADSLIAAGLALVYGFQDNQEFLAPLIARQREAIGRGSGIWSALSPADEEFYLASTIGFRFHRPGCKSAAKIRADHRLRYDARHAAYYDGLAPCRNCKP